jgi:hypothetical protein
MRSGEAPRLRVMPGGGLSGAAVGGGARLRAVEQPRDGRPDGADEAGGGTGLLEQPRGGGAPVRTVGRPRESGRRGGGGVFDWREELELLAPDVVLPQGCSRHALAAAEGSLGLRFPAELVEFLGAADGVYDVDSHHWYAWSLERLVDENFEAERPRDLLLIGDDAGSGWFCLPLHGGSGALHYNRITAERRTIARDLRGLWLGWFGGTLGV